MMGQGMGKAEQLTAHERDTIRAALGAAVGGPYFPDWEFATLMGVTRSEAADVLATWPTTDDPETQDLAVNNILLHLLAYPHGEDEALSRDVPVSREELRAILERWRSVR